MQVRFLNTRVQAYSPRALAQACGRCWGVDFCPHEVVAGRKSCPSMEYSMSCVLRGLGVGLSCDPAIVSRFGERRQNNIGRNAFMSVGKELFLITN